MKKRALSLVPIIHTLAITFLLLAMCQPAGAFEHVDTTQDDFRGDGEPARFNNTTLGPDNVLLELAEDAWGQSDWSAGPGHNVWNNQNGYSSGDGIEHNTSGQVTLWPRYGHWSQAADAPHDGIDMASVWAGDRFIITGGFTSSAETAQVWEYFPDTDAWNRLTDMPAERFDHTAAWNGTDLFVFGGDATMNSLLVYNRTLNSWTALPDAPINRTRHTMVHNGQSNLFVFGGKDDSLNDIAEIWSYNITTGTWVRLTSAPKAMSGHAAAWNEAEGVMIATGGEGAIGYLWDTLAYDPGTDKWQERAHMPDSRKFHSIVWDPVVEKAFVFGGVAGSEYFDDIHIYDYDEDSWEEGVSCPVAMSSHAAAWGGGAMVVFGGRNLSAYYDHTWSYRYDENRSTGWLVSSAVDLGTNVTVEEIAWGGLILLDTTMEFQLASNTDHMTWSYIGPDGTSSTRYNQTFKNVSQFHDGDRYFRYKAFLTSDNGSKSPVLASFYIYYNHFISPGYFTSSVIDLKSDEPVISSIDWDSEEPTGTSIKMTITSSPSLNMTAPTIENRTVTKGESITENVSRYLTYMAKLISMYTHTTPVLQEVRISYTAIPALTGGKVEDTVGMQDDTFEYSVTYTDQAGRAPLIAQVVIDGLTHDMTTNATNFTAGARFTYNTTLDPGIHNFYFNFRVENINLRYPTTGTLQGPTVKAVNHAPVAVITLPIDETVFQTGSSFRLKGDESYDPDGDPLYFKWESSLSGRLSTQASYNVTLYEQGRHTINLTVTDPFGVSSVATVNVSVLHTIDNEPPVPIVTGDFIRKVDERVTVDANHSSDPDGRVVVWYFDWGDGSAEDVQTPDTGGGVGEHVYTKAGNYTVTVTVKDNNGATNFTEVNVFIKEDKEPPEPPTPGPEVTAESGFLIGVILVILLVIVLALVVARREKD